MRMNSTTFTEKLFFVGFDIC